MSPADSELLERYATKRCPEAFAELVARYLALVYHAALRQVGGRSDAAEEITQSVFVLLARKAPALAGHGLLAGWLHTTTRYKAHEYLRAERRRRNREEEAQAMQEMVNTQAEEASWAALRPVLDDALGELKPTDRDAILWRFYTALPLAEIGTRFAVSENAARMRVERALERLRERLVRRGITSTAAALAVTLANSSTAAVPAGLAGTVTAMALAQSAAGAAGASLTAFLIMNHAKVIVGVAAVLSIGGLGSAIWQAAELRSSRAALAEANSVRDTLQQRLSEAEAQLAAIQPGTQPSVTQPTSAVGGRLPTQRLPGGRNASSAGGQEPSEKPLDRVAMNQFLTGDASYRSLVVKLQRAELGLKFGPFYHAQHLSSAQIAAFEDAIVDHVQSHMEAMAVAAEKGVPAPDPTLTALVTSLNNRLGTRLNEAVGVEKMAHFSDYEKSLTARETVNTLAGNLYYTDVPLTATQAEQLVALVTKNTGEWKQQGLASTPRPVDWDAIMAQAQGVLAPTQLATLRSLAERARYQQQISELVSAIAVDSKSPVLAQAPADAGGG